MKTSSKIFVATLLLLLGSLTAYNMALRHEFRQGTYERPATQLHHVGPARF